MLMGFIVHWNTGEIPVNLDTPNNLPVLLIPLGMGIGSGEGGSTSISVNQKHPVNGNIELDAGDVGADPTGTAQDLVGTPIDFVSLINATMEI